MKKFSDKDIRKLELFSIVTSLLLAVFCVIYLLDLVRNDWLLFLLLLSGALLHLIVALTDLIRRQHWKMAIALGFCLLCLTGMFYV